MAKLFLFGIGGTGVRTLRALTMLFASGVKLKNFDEVVPVIIDPDTQLADLHRFLPVIQAYQRVQKKADENGFFSTKISDPFGAGKGFLLQLDRRTNVRFDEYMNFNQLDPVNKALMNLLFSKKNQQSDMSVGFKGNPNVGSVVLDQFESSDDFRNLAQRFNQGDAIFIVSSIFGGTGASGFPALVRTLRKLDNNFPNAAVLKQAPIGAVTVLPYFNLTQDGTRTDTIDSTTFISKTKAALRYYERNIAGASGVNMLYYVGDYSKMATFENHDGGNAQRNRAHMIELLAALSLINFANTYQGVSQTIYKEFSLPEDEAVVDFTKLGPWTKETLCRPMTCFALFSKYLNEQIKDSLNQLWATAHSIDYNFTSSNFYQDVLQVSSDYREWLNEMSDSGNGRKFEPFDMAINKNNVFGLVKGMPEQTSIFGKKNYSLFDDRLNGKQNNSEVNVPDTDKYFLKLFDAATRKLARERLNIR